jgi:hypothetical protein
MGTRSALIVATSEYADPKLPDLLGPTRDASELERVLADPAIGGFDVEVAADALVHDLRRRLERFFLTSRTRDDLLLLQLSCHGLKDDAGRLYFAAADTELEHLFSTGVSDKWLQELIDESRSQRIVLLLDCCFGGAFSSAFARRAPGAEQVGIKERFEGRGRVVLSASTATQYAFEGGRLDGSPVPSVFTSAIVAGLESGAADRDEDGQISVDELYDYALERVREQDARQTPTKAGYVEGDLFLARSRRPPRIKAKPLPRDLQNAIASRDGLRRLGAVSELTRLAGEDDPGRALSATEALRQLADDDSRRVSDAAAAALSSLPNAPVGPVGTQVESDLRRPPSDPVPPADDLSRQSATQPALTVSLERRDVTGATGDAEEEPAETAAPLVAPARQSAREEAPASSVRLFAFDDAPAVALQPTPQAAFQTTGASAISHERARGWRSILAWGIVGAAFGLAIGAAGAEVSKANTGFLRGEYVPLGVAGGLAAALSIGLSRTAGARRVDDTIALILHPALGAAGLGIPLLLLFGVLNDVMGFNSGVGLAILLSILPLGSGSGTWLALRAVSNRRRMGSATAVGVLTTGMFFGALALFGDFLAVVGVAFGLGPLLALVGVERSYRSRAQSPGGFD